MLNAGSFLRLKTLKRPVWSPVRLACSTLGKTSPNPSLCFYQDPKRHLEESVEVMMTSDIVQCLGAMLNSVVF